MMDQYFEKSEIRVIHGTEEFHGPEIYKLTPGLSRGKMMIVNFKEFADKDYDRVGSEKDTENLTSLFHQIGDNLYKFKTET